MFDLLHATVLVTGGHGFLGAHVLPALAAAGAARVVAPRAAECDLREVAAVRALLDRERPDAVVHLAANVGGIGANVADPAGMLQDNLLMGIHLLDAARQRGVRKFLTVGTACSYPERCPAPFREETLWDGYPAPETAPYGLAKKMLLALSAALRAQHGFPAIFVLPTNLYGPGDRFDLERGHVVPSLVRKFVEGTDRGDPEVEVWGDGRATREFLHVRDAARGLVDALERYDAPEPVNLGTGCETSIRELAETLARLAGFRGRIAWRTDRPTGQPRRVLEVSRARTAFGFRSRIPLEDGLRETVEAFRRSRAHKGT
ncbi:MAG: NAD-dependent epimerase/dehydratase family protein [Planctomycetes bacterium]|nr:NAD-dependent epimerase/dehydratase family protein [Planctomycetota bacterium]